MPISENAHPYYILWSTLKDTDVLRIRWALKLLDSRNQRKGVHDKGYAHVACIAVQEPYQRNSWELTTALTRVLRGIHGNTGKTIGELSL